MTIFRLKQHRLDLRPCGGRRHALELRPRRTDRRRHRARGSACVGGLVAATVLIVLHRDLCQRARGRGGSVYSRACWRCWEFRRPIICGRCRAPNGCCAGFDHSAIYLLIAATYTPFIMQMKDSLFAIALLAGVWCVAIVGIVMKLALPGPFRPALGRCSIWRWAGAASWSTTPWCRRCRRWRCGSSPPAALLYTFRRDLPCLGAAALPERDLALLCACWARPAIIPPCSIWCLA